MLIGNHGDEKLRQFLFPPERVKFVPKLAAVFIPYTLMKGASLSCECDNKQSALRDGVGVGRGYFGKGSVSVNTFTNVCDISGRRRVPFYFTTVVTNQKCTSCSYLGRQVFLLPAGEQNTK